MGSFVFNTTTDLVSMISITTSHNASSGLGGTYTFGGFNTVTTPQGVLDQFSFINTSGSTLDLTVAPPLSLTLPNSLNTAFSEEFETAGHRFVTSGSLD